ncbi:MAG: TonB-dependent receptor [Bacteroidales bacterium]|nr:TonB-dependent receptor [Bacteroidales bacterium]
MKSLRLIIYLILALIIPISGLTQTMVIKGIVLDKDNNIPLTGANVVIMGTNKGTVTDQNGQFILSALSSTNCTLTVSYAGYVSEEKNIREGNDTLIRFYMEEAYIDLNTVVITATRTEKKLKNVPVLTQVITAKQLEAVPRNNIQDILEAYVPDINYTRAGFGTRMAMQDLDAKFILFLIDGERIAGELYGNIDYDRIDVNNIERIEIIRGASSSLYGSNAIGGVINIITKESTKKIEAHVTSRVSKYNDISSHINTGFNLNKFGSQTEAGYKTMDGYDLDDDPGYMTVHPYTSYIASQKFSYKPIEGLHMSIKGSYYTLERYDIDPVPLHKSYDDMNLHFKSNYKFSGKNKLEASWFTDQYRTYDVYELLDDEKRVVYNDLIHNARLMQHIQITTNQYLTLGTEFLQESLFSERIEGEDKQVNDWIFFAQNDINITQVFNSVVGFRLNTNSNYGFRITPQISMMYKLTDLKFRASYNAGYRAPTLKELYMQFSPIAVIEINGNENLTPETSNHFSASVEYSTSSFNTSFIAYHNRINDLITEINEPVNSPVWTYQNVNKVRINGLETSINTKLPLGFSANCTYNYNDLIDNATNKQVWGSYTHSGIAGLNYQYKAKKYRLNTGIYGKFIGDLYYNEVDMITGEQYDYTIPAHSIWKFVTTQYIKPGIAVTLGVDNIFDIVKKEHIIWMNPGRRFFAGINLQIDEFFTNLNK